MKTCFKCKETKPLGEFYKHGGMADGHLNKCKRCAKLDAKEYQSGAARDRYLEYQRSKPKTERSMASTASWKTQHPKRRAAQVAVGNAVRDGRLTPLPCFECGKKAEAHHPNYDAPLDVVWLCSSHHKQAHALMKD